MKTLLTVLFVSALYGSAVVAIEPSKWVSPNGGVSIELTYTQAGQSQAGDPLLTGTTGGNSVAIRESPLIASPFSREFGGITWLGDITPNWINDRYLVFELSDRIAVIDAAQRLMILNTSFEALTKAPAGERWGAIRFRPVTRKQQSLDEDFRDTLFVIDLPKVIAASSLRNDVSTPFQHLQSVKLPGIALAKPIWMTQGDAELLAIAIWAGGRAEALSLNPKTLEVLERKSLGIPVNNEVALSPWINLAAEPEIIRAAIRVLSDAQGSKPSAQFDLPSSVQSAKPKVFELKPAPSSDKSALLMPLSVVAVLIVAALGLMWLLLKRRS